MNPKIDCDILIVGGGVAGLSAGIALSKRELNTVLIEKESEIGFKIKGEVIKKESPIFSEIFGTELPKHVITNELRERRLYSPSTRKYIDIVHTEPTVTIDYRAFILELFRELAKTKCNILLNTELMDIIDDKHLPVGGICSSENQELKIFAKYFIGADGVHSKFLRLLEPKSEREVFHALKLNYENLQIPNYRRLELYLMTDPPGAMWMFPKGPTSGECGLVVWTQDLPNDFDILELWNKKSQENKVLSKIIENAKPYYISKDFLNFGGPLKQIFGKKFVLLGDSAGHVGAIGGSGIVSCITTGYRIGNFIANALYTKKEVTEGRTQEFMKNFKRSPIQKYLKNEQSLGKALRTILFQTFKTAENIDNNWYKLEKMYTARSSQKK